MYNLHMRDNISTEKNITYLYGQIQNAHLRAPSTAPWPATLENILVTSSCALPGLDKAMRSAEAVHLSVMRSAESTTKTPNVAAMTIEKAPRAIARIFRIFSKSSSIFFSSSVLCATSSALVASLQIYANETN